MTCIIARRSEPGRPGWMVADRRCNASGTLLNPYHPAKIHRAGGYLFGSAGTARLGSIFRELAEVIREHGDVQWAGRNIFDAIVNRVRDQPPNERYGQAHALVLSHEGIWEIGSDGSVNQCDPECQIWAIGSGYQAALGWYIGAHLQMEARLRPLRDMEIILAKGAIEFAGTLNADVGDGTQLEQLEPEPEPSGSPPEAPTP